MQAGLKTLKDLGLLQAAAQKQIDYSTLAEVVHAWHDAAKVELAKTHVTLTH